MAKKKTKRNPNDLTLRNLRAMRTRIDKLEARITVLEHAAWAPSTLDKRPG